MEIKVNNPLAKSATTTLSTSTKGLSSFVNMEDGEDSKLTLIEKINEINHTYETILDQYKTMLLKNVDMTEESIEALTETDEELATQMSMEEDI